MITDNLPKEEIITLDVSFVLEMLTKIDGAPVEAKLISYYSMRTNATENMYDKFKTYMHKRHQCSNDKELFEKIRAKTFKRIVNLVKTTIDAMVIRKAGCEVLDAVFTSFVTATKDEVIIKIKVSR